MDTKSFEVMLHSQYAFDKCRENVHTYEDCRQTSDPIPKDPRLCRQEARNLVGCYKEAEKMHPLCLAPFNDARECLFKSDGNLFNCRPFIDLYVVCQKDENEYQEILKNSTTKQRQPVIFDFFKHRGHFDRYT
ncbi:hypothetical protein pb186bvf_006308 [Paramecium bursaria]